MKKISIKGVANRLRCTARVAGNRNPPQRYRDFLTGAARPQLARAPDQTLSKMPAAPCPMPTHMVTMPYFS